MGKEGQRAALAVDEQVGSRLASLMLAAAAGREARSSDDGGSGDQEEADSDPQPQFKPAVRKPAFAGRGAGKGAGKSRTTRIMAGPQAPLRTVRPEEPSAYPVGALTQELLRDDEVARIMKHLEKKGFDMDEDDKDIGPGGGGIRPTRGASKRDEILLGTRCLHSL